MADIGDVDHMGRRPTFPVERAAQGIGEDVGAQIAEMREIINRWSAAVEPRHHRIDRLEGFGGSRQAVEQLEGSAMACRRFRGYGIGQGHALLSPVRMGNDANESGRPLPDARSSF